jgi:GNAT superfamily N-acetyltransferase
MASTALGPAIALPAVLDAEGYALRPETDADLPFLSTLYASTRETELAAMRQWTAAQTQAFLAQQFFAQRHHYRTQIAGCAFWVIERGGTPIGRLYLQERVTQWHVVDIALLPDWRGKGIGTALIHAVIAAARDQAKAVGLFVDRRNIALRLYRRLGFVEIGATAFHLEMAREVAPDADRAS